MEHLFLRELCRGTWRGAPLLWIRKDMGRKAQGTGLSLRGGPAREPGRGLVYRGLRC
jgi:hypothetical protein